MSKQYNIELDINQVSEWSKNQFSDKHDFTRTGFRTDEQYAQHVSEFPPKEIFTKLSKLIVEEGVDPDDIQVFLKNESEELLPVNIPLSLVYETDKKINEQISNRVSRG